MKFGIYNAIGEVLRTGECPDDGIDGVLLQPGESVFQGEITENDLVDTATGELIPNGKPPAPSPDHDWDAVARLWVGNIERARARKRDQIERERDARSAAPVLVYDEKNLDADEVSIERLKSKLTEIDSAQALGMTLPAEQLVWRDADNVTHVFADQPAYKTWLQGFAVALGARGTIAFAWSWQKKAQLDALTTFDEVVAFNPTT